MFKHTVKKTKRTFFNDPCFSRKIFWKNQFSFFCSYNIISSLLDQFGLVIEYGKTEVFHFSRSYGFFNSPLLDLSPIRGPVLFLKTTW